uniref:Chromo domain-containing protein n=1 Tax=Globodera pallida TaxID=36090 RepID=A0A183BSQ9_GLOPA
MLGAYKSRWFQQYNANEIRNALRGIGPEHITTHCIPSSPRRDAICHALKLLSRLQGFAKARMLAPPEIEEPVSAAEEYRSKQSSGFNQQHHDQHPQMENGFVDVTSIEEQQDEADFEQNTSSNKNGSADPPAVPALTRVVEIERIVDERGRGAKKSSEQHEYLVKWKSVKQCWLSAADLKKFPQLTEAFEKRKGQKSTARNEDEVARDGAEHHDETDDNDANQYTDHDYTGTQQVPSKHPLQNGGIAKSDDLVRSSSRQHRPTKRFVEETNEAVERGKKARRTSPRKSGKKAGKSVLEEGNDEEEEQDVEYAVEKVLKKRERGSRVQYRVKWAGYDSSYNSWEPRNGLKHLDIVKQFEQEQSALEEKTDDNLEEDKFSFFIFGLHLHTD